MGMRLIADYTVPTPHPITLIVTCDGRGGLFPCEAKASFDATEGHPRDPAVKAGWNFDPNGPIFCPQCR